MLAFNILNPNVQTQLGPECRLCYCSCPCASPGFLSAACVISPSLGIVSLSGSSQIIAAWQASVWTQVWNHSVHLQHRPAEPQGDKKMGDHEQLWGSNFTERKMWCKLLFSSPFCEIQDGPLARDHTHVIVLVVGWLVFLKIFCSLEYSRSQHSVPTGGLSLRCLSFVFWQGRGRKGRKY